MIDNLLEALAPEGVTEVVWDVLSHRSAFERALLVTFSNGSVERMVVDDARALHSDYGRMFDDVVERVRSISPVKREAKRLKWMTAVWTVRARKCGRRSW